MPRTRHRTTLDRFFLSLTALFVLGGFMALGFSKRISEENRALFVIVSSIGMLAGLAGLMFVGALWRRLRKWTWERTMSSWSRASRAKSNPTSALPNPLDESELRQLAIRIYSRLGYRLADRKVEGAYLHLINPEWQLELVAYKQQPDPLALHHVYSLDLEMNRIKAVRAFFWAPTGFTDECREWVVNRPIVLADHLEIERLIDCSQSKGLNLLEH